MILLLTLLLLAGGGATSYPLAIKETLKWVLLVLAYIFTRTTIRTDRAARGLLVALFLTGSAEAIMGAVQFFVPFGPPAFAVGPFIRAHGMFGQPNPFAGYLGTILPIALAMTLDPAPRPLPPRRGVQRPDDRHGHLPQPLARRLARVDRSRSA